MLKNSIVFIPLAFLIISSSAKQQISSILSKVKTDKSFVQSSLNPKNIYAIDIERVATSKENQTSKCMAQQKQIKSFNQFEKFRVGSTAGRQQSVYETLTTLPDKQDGIQSFKILGDKIMMIMLNGTAYFLQKTKDLQTNPKPVDLKLNLYAGKYKFTPYITPINGNAFVATPREVSFCEPKINKCTKIEGFKGVDSLYNFYAYEYKGKQYLFFLTGLTLTTYQISSNAVAFNEKVYNAEFFNKSKVFLQQVLPIPGDKILILDFYVGLFELSHSPISLADIKNVSGVAYEQYGCRHMTSSKQGSFLALQCSLTQKTFFILQLVKPESSSSKYSAQQPIFFNQVLTGIDSSSEIIMANIFSGVRLFWTSTDIQSPYPYDFQKAGSIFLHNAKGSQITLLNDRKAIYICTQDQLRVYELTVKSPQVVCFSTVPIKQQYKLTYTYLCDKQSLLHLKVCTVEKRLNYEAWEHKQVNIKATLLPLLVSFLLVVAIGMILVRLYRKYDQQIQAARLKYNTNDDFGIQGN